MPQDFHGHHDASAHDPHWNTCCTHVQSPPSASDQHSFSFLFRHELFYSPYADFGWDAEKGLDSWERKEKEEGMVGKKRGVSPLKANVNS